MFVPCPLTLVMKTMSQSAAKNFQALFDYVYDDARFVLNETTTHVNNNNNHVIPVLISLIL